MKTQNKQKQVTQQMSQIWSQIVDALSLSQYERCMGGDMSFKSKAQRAMRVSKSREVQGLCQDIISLYEMHFEKPAVSLVDDKFFSVFE